jgi:hypothetical protein
MREGRQQRKGIFLNGLLKCLLETSPTPAAQPLPLLLGKEIAKDPVGCRPGCSRDALENAPGSIMYIIPYLSTFKSLLTSSYPVPNTPRFQLLPPRDIYRGFEWVTQYFLQCRTTSDNITLMGHKLWCSNTSTERHSSTTVHNNTMSTKASNMTALMKDDPQSPLNHRVYCPQ